MVAAKLGCGLSLFMMPFMSCLFDFKADPVAFDSDTDLNFFVFVSRAD